MSPFEFRYPEWQEVAPSAWVQKWAALYELTEERKQDNSVYQSLIEKREVLSGEDFELVGRWKEGCLSKKKMEGKENKRWKPESPVAYDVWMQAKRDQPKCPTDTDDAIAEFLNDWSERKFRKLVKGGQLQETRFGLPRASTLLHFISVGRFPIFDQFVRIAMGRLGSKVPQNLTAHQYLEKFCRTFAAIAANCSLSSIGDLRKLDNALRCYGGKTFPLSKMAEPRGK